MREKKQEENKTKVKSTFDENAFVDGHLEHYPNFAEQYATFLKKNRSECSNLFWCNR